MTLSWINFKKPLGKIAHFLSTELQYKVTKMSLLTSHVWMTLITFYFLLSLPPLKFPVSSLHFWNVLMLFILFWIWSDVEKRKNLVCGLSTPLEGSEAEAHRKPEVRNWRRFWCVLHLCSVTWTLSVVLCGQAIILEGSYWKRRIEVVIKEYHKWRIYYKKRVRLAL